MKRVVPVAETDIFPGDELLGQIPALIHELAAFLRAPAEEAIAANAVVTARVRFAAVLFGLVAFTTACAQSDAGITTSVKTELAADDLVKARNIDVDTNNRVVTLTGNVQSEQEQARAIEIARGTGGVVDNVVRVEDKLTVDRQPR